MATDTCLPDELAPVSVGTGSDPLDGDRAGQTVAEFDQEGIVSVVTGICRPDDHLVSVRQIPEPVVRGIYRRDESRAVRSVPAFDREDTSSEARGTCRQGECLAAELVLAFDPAGTSSEAQDNDRLVFRERSLEGTLAAPCPVFVLLAVALTGLWVVPLSFFCHIRLLPRDVPGALRRICRPMMRSASCRASAIGCERTSSCPRPR